MSTDLKGQTPQTEAAGITAASSQKRLLLLASKLGYQTRSFAEATKRVGAEVVLATDRCHQIDDPWADGAIAVHFDDPESAAQGIIEKTHGAPITGVLALGDRPTETAAYVARALGLPYSSPEAVRNCRSKLAEREVLHSAGLPVPAFFSFALSEPIEQVLQRVEFPCVVKPLTLSASQGVVRANNAKEFAEAVALNRRLLNSPEIQVTREAGLDRLLVEHYIHGGEVAVEGLLSGGKLRVLAVFDKPDPLEGPYFEETIYVTPSRLHRRVLQSIHECAARTVAVLGLTDGPVHAEFRIAHKTHEPWVLEASPRPIGGLCARVLRFGPKRMPLEELLVRHSLGLPGSDLEREPAAAGVMMIPVPVSGVLEKVEGLDSALSTPGIEAVEITARIHDVIAAWPEGSSYLGFIFARGEEPAKVERSLRRAHVRLDFKINAPLPVENATTRRLPGIARHATSS
jgi:formate-dependent phosphoribosylglycinamide formyltransferase (GAR transformylase)